MATGSLDAGSGGFLEGLNLRGILQGVADWDVARRQAESAQVSVQPASGNQPTGNAGMTATDYTPSWGGMDQDTMIKTALGVAAVVVAAGVVLYIARKVV